jgi:hypothetical protein
MGMAAAFIEPLEASAIFLIEAGSNMLANIFPRNRDALKNVANVYNESFNYRWARTIDFVKMHYVLSNRNDSEFWTDNKKLSSIPQSLTDQLNHWKSHPITTYDFPNTFEPFVMESYQFIYYGMMKDIKYHHNGSFPDTEKAKSIFEQIDKMTKQALIELPNHRELINKIYDFGMQKI